MTVVLAVASNLAATVCAWAMARRAAGARACPIGGFPVRTAAAGALVAGVAAARGGIGPSGVAVLAAVGVAAVTDRRCGAIFDLLTATLAATIFSAALLAGTTTDALAGSAATGGFALFLHAVTRGRGIGWGDVKLAAGIGAALGVALGALALAAAFVSGGAYGAWLLLTHRAERGARLPFAPFLATGTIVALVGPGLPA